MTREASLTFGGNGSDRTVSVVQSVQSNSPERSSLFSGLMDAVRRRLPGPKVAEQFAAIIKCEPRSAARYLAGERVPDGNQTFEIFLHPTLGPPAMAAVMAEAERRLSASDFATFQVQMMRATVRADVRDNNERR